MRKKILGIFVSMILCCSLCGCGQTGQDSVTPQINTQSNTQFVDTGDIVAICGNDYHVIYDKKNGNVYLFHQYNTTYQGYESLCPYAGANGQMKIEEYQQSRMN